MKKKNKSTVACWSLAWIGSLLLSCSDASKTEHQGTIRVAEAMENLQELKVSQLGSRIRYVPLETSDSALVANDWNLLVTDKYAIVCNLLHRPKCMVFDLNTGKYIATVGHRGQDPEAYDRCVPTVDNAGGEVIYFPGPNGMVKYSVDNRFLGSVKMKRRSSLLMICDTTATQILVDRDSEGERCISYLRTDLHGNLTDSMVVVGPKLITAEISILYSNATISLCASLMPHSSEWDYAKVEGQRKGERAMVEYIGKDQMWQMGGATHFRQAFSDSIYRMVPGSASVVYVFDTGKWRYPVEWNGKEEITSEHAFITDITETPCRIVFAVSKGWLDEDNKGYVGLYDKKDGTTLMGKIEDGFRDDLAGFAPFYPIRTNAKGQLVGVLTIEEIAEWLEEHPDAEKPAFVDALADDANPVLVIVE